MHVFVISNYIQNHAHVLAQALSPVS